LRRPLVWARVQPLIPGCRWVNGTTSPAGAVYDEIKDDARMTQMNKEWATEQLDTFLGLTELYRPLDPPGGIYQGG